MDDLENKNIGDVPKHLKDAHYSGAKKLGVGGYKYPHNYENNYVSQQYLPDNLEGIEYYSPQNNKYENSIKVYWENIKK